MANGTVFLRRARRPRRAVSRLTPTAGDGCIAHGIVPHRRGRRPYGQNRDLPQPTASLHFLRGSGPPGRRPLQMVRPHFQNKNTTRMGGHRYGGRRVFRRSAASGGNSEAKKRQRPVRQAVGLPHGWRNESKSLGGCRRRHARGLGNMPPACCHRATPDRPVLASSPRKKILDTQRVSSIFWSGRRGSNSLPRPWQGRALPDELRPRNGIDYSVSRRRCQPRICYFTVKLPAPFPPGRRPLPAFPPFLRSPAVPPPSAGFR